MRECVVCVLGQRLTLGVIFLNHSSSECSKAGALTERGIYQWANLAHQGARDQPLYCHILARVTVAS